MKKVITMSVYKCFNFVVDNPDKEPYIIISIQDTQNNGFGFTFNKSKYCVDVLTLYFDDIDRDTPGLKMFTSEQAAEIVNFVKQHEKVAKIIVHCYAGESRSAAVAQAIAEEFGAIQINKQPSPNRHVYNTLKKEFEKEKSC